MVANEALMGPVRKTIMLPRLGLPGQTYFNAAFADGSVRALPLNMAETNLRNLITRNDGFVVKFE